MKPQRNEKIKMNIYVIATYIICIVCGFVVRCAVGEVSSYLFVSVAAFILFNFVPVKQSDGSYRWDSI